MKKITLSENELVKLISKIIKEDYGTELSDEIINGAKELINKTVKVQRKYNNGFISFGVFKIVDVYPNNKKDRLNLGLTLERLTDERGEDVNSSAQYGVSGTCDGQNFKFGSLRLTRGRGELPEVTRLTNKLGTYLGDNWCKLYTKKGTDY